MNYYVEAFYSSREEDEKTKYDYKLKVVNGKELLLVYNFIPVTNDPNAWNEMLHKSELIEKCNRFNLFGIYLVTSDERYEHTEDFIIPTDKIGEI